jgi:hypothetical protein
LEQGGYAEHAGVVAARKRLVSIATLQGSLKAGLESTEKARVGSAAKERKERKEIGRRRVKASISLSSLRSLAAQMSGVIKLD